MKGSKVNISVDPAQRCSCILEVEEYALSLEDPSSPRNGA